VAEASHAPIRNDSSKNAQCKNQKAYMHLCLKMNGKSKKIAISSDRIQLLMARKVGSGLWIAGETVVPVYFR
jgi:hypothetical protein